MQTTINKPDNRRQFVRVLPAPNAPVRVHINGEDFIEVTNAVDISEGGIRILVGHRFVGCHTDLPAAFIVHLPAPINKHISIKGRIKHVLGDSYGLQFAGLSDASRALIRRYVQQRLGQPAATGFLDSFRNLFGLRTGAG